MTNVDFAIANNFKKLHPMPDYRTHRVAANQVEAEGTLLCYTRHKGWFRDVISKQTPRPAVLTKAGYLLIWMKPTKGFTLRLSQACDITMKTKAIRSAPGMLCRIKVHFYFGTLNVMLLNANISLWRTPLVLATEMQGNKKSCPKSGPHCCRDPVLEEKKMTGPLAIMPAPLVQRVETQPFVTLPNTDEEVSQMEQHVLQWEDVTEEYEEEDSYNFDEILEAQEEERVERQAREVEIARVKKEKQQHVSFGGVRVVDYADSTTLDTLRSMTEQDKDRLKARWMDNRTVFSPTPFSPAKEHDRDIYLVALQRPQKAVVVTLQDINHSEAVVYENTITIPAKRASVEEYQLPRPDAPVRSRSLESQLPVSWLRSQIEHRVKRLDGMPVPPDEPKPVKVALVRPQRRQRSRSASSNLVSMRE